MMSDSKSIKECRKKFREATGTVIKRKRKQKNITQKELGEALEVTDSTVGRYILSGQKLYSERKG